MITFKNPASERDFTSIFIKIKGFNKAKADEKAQSRQLRDERIF